MSGYCVHVFSILHKVKFENGIKAADTALRSMEALHNYVSHVVNDLYVKATVCFEKKI